MCKNQGGQNTHLEFSYKYLGSKTGENSENRISSKSVQALYGPRPTPITNNLHPQSPSMNEPEFSWPKLLISTPTRKCAPGNAEIIITI